MRCLIFPNPFETQGQPPPQGQGRGSHSQPKSMEQSVTMAGLMILPKSRPGQVEEALDQAGIESQSFNSSLLQEPWKPKTGPASLFRYYALREIRQIIYREPFPTIPLN